MPREKRRSPTEMGRPCRYARRTREIYFGYVPATRPISKMPNDCSPGESILEKKNGPISIVRRPLRRVVESFRAASARRKFGRKH